MERKRRLRLAEYEANPPVPVVRPVGWSREEVFERVLALYQYYAARGGNPHYRTAALFDYGAPGSSGQARKRWLRSSGETDETPRFVVFTIEVGMAHDTLGTEAFDSLEEARSAAVQFVGEPRE